MAGLMSEEDLMDILRQQKEEQLPTVDLEQLMMERLLNPNRIQKTQSRIVEHSPEGILKQVVKATRLNEAGFQEEIEEEVHYIYMLDDGTAAGDMGIVRCQTCNAIVKEANIHRCTCGNTCCVLCGRYSNENEQWYCSWWHKFQGGKIPE